MAGSFLDITCPQKTSTEIRKENQVYYLIIKQNTPHRIHTFSFIRIFSHFYTIYF